MIEALKHYRSDLMVDWFCPVLGSAKAKGKTDLVSRGLHAFKQNGPGLLGFVDPTRTFGSWLTRSAEFCKKRILVPQVRKFVKVTRLCGPKVRKS